jgi:hypothetical protein
MKKLIPILLLLAACQAGSTNGKYVNHTNGQYAITDDTLEIQDSTMISRSGYQKIRNGKTLPKEFKTQQLLGLHPTFGAEKLLLNGTTYQKIN